MNAFLKYAEVNQIVLSQSLRGLKTHDKQAAYSSLVRLKKWNTDFPILIMPRALAGTSDLAKSFLFPILSQRYTNEDLKSQQSFDDSFSAVVDSLTKRLTLCEVQYTARFHPTATPTNRVFAELLYSRMAFSTSCTTCHRIYTATNDGALSVSVQVAKNSRKAKSTEPFPPIVPFPTCLAWDLSIHALHVAHPSPSNNIFRPHQSLRLTSTAAVVITTQRMTLNSFLRTNYPTGIFHLSTNKKERCSTSRFL
jgi:hypothetical protein